jgi:HAMP domain-containing protein
MFLFAYFRISKLLTALQQFKEKENRRVDDLIATMEEKSGLKKLVRAYHYPAIVDSSHCVIVHQEASVFEKEEQIDNLQRELQFKKEFVRLQQQQEGISYEELRMRLEDVAMHIVKSKLEASEKLRLHAEECAAKLDRENAEVAELNNSIARMLQSMEDDLDDENRYVSIYHT